MMRAAGGIGAQTNAPKRKMDALAGIRGHCGLLNDPERLKRLKEQSDLALSLASIRRAQQEEKKSKKEAGVAGLFNKAPEALLKLDKKGMDALKLTKEEICSVAHCCFSTTLNSSLKKPKLVSDFEELVAKHPQVLPVAISQAKANPALAAAAHEEEEEEDFSENGGGGGGDHTESDDE
jgi:hypothetical protein